MKTVLKEKINHNQGCSELQLTTESRKKKMPKCGLGNERWTT